MKTALILTIIGLVIVIYSSIENAIEDKKERKRPSS
jgi:hypothetical protein